MAKAKRLFVIGYDGMNPLLLRRFIDEGCLPTFKALLARGSLNRLLPTIPAWTPTNWSSMVTGAPAGTTRLPGWTIRQKTAPWGSRRIMSWEHAALGGAETLWEIADAAGLKTLIDHYPSASYGAPLKHGFVVAPGLHDPPLEHALAMEYFATVRRDARTHVDTTGQQMGTRTVDVEEEGAPPGSSVVRLEPAASAGWRNVSDADLGAALPIVLLENKGTEYVYLLVRRGSAGSFERVAVCAKPDGSTVLVEVPLKGWSPFTYRQVGPEHAEASMRFRVLAANPTAGSLHLVRSVVYGTRGYAQPAGFDAEIFEACGPFYDRLAVNPIVDEEHLNAVLDELRFMAEWQVGVARHVQNRYGWDLHFSHWHTYDFLNHPTINGMDPDGPDYDPRRGEWLTECQRRAYILGDEILAQFLELERPGDLVCVISDHAMAPTHRFASIQAHLVETGFIVLGPDGRPDFTKSKAYLLADHGAEIFVNLEGREPMGIVPHDQYEQVQEELVDAMLDWRDPLNGKRPIALALKLQDAQVIGLWGETAGDVVAIMNRGYGWGEPRDGGSVGKARGAIHGSQIPTSEKGDLSNMAALLISGPGVKVGYERDWQRFGLMREIDMAPTWAHLLGLRTPRHSLGAVLHDLLEE